MQSVLKEIVKLKDKGTVPLVERLWNDLRSNEMFFTIYWNFLNIYFRYVSTVFDIRHILPNKENVQLSKNFRPRSWKNQQHFLKRPILQLLDNLTFCKVIFPAWRSPCITELINYRQIGVNHFKGLAVHKQAMIALYCK